MLGRDLYDHFEGEASRLKKAYDYNIQYDLPTNEIVDRLLQYHRPRDRRVDSMWFNFKSGCQLIYDKSKKSIEDKT